MLDPTTKSVVPSNTWEWTHTHASRRSEQIQKQILRDSETQTYCRYTLLLASLARVGSSVLRWQTVRLFLTIDLSSLLCKVWFHSGKYEMGPGEGSRLGQGGTPYSRASYLRVTLGILPWHSFQPLRCLKPPPWVFATSLPMIGAFQLGTAPGWSPTSPSSHPLWLKEGKGRKMQRRPLTKRSTMWALMMAAWMWCLPAADPYGCHSPAFYNLTIHSTARRRCLTDPSPRSDW